MSQRKRQQTEAWVIWLCLWEKKLSWVTIIRNQRWSRLTWAYARESVEPLRWADHLPPSFFFLLRIKNRTQDPPKTCHFSIPSFSLNFSMSLTRSHVVFSSKHALLDWPSVQTNIKVNKPPERTVSTFQRLADQIRRSESTHWAFFRDFKIT